MSQEIMVRDWLKQLRRDARMSAAAVALKVGVSAETVYRWESGEKNPGRENMISLAGLFGSVVYEKFAEESQAGA